MPSMICVAMLVDEPSRAIAAAERARDEGADLVEYRLDTLFAGEGDDAGAAACLEVVARSPLPCIATCRPVYEGGGYEGDDESRFGLFEAMIAADRPPRYIDVEARALRRAPGLRARLAAAIRAAAASAGDDRTRLILSRHDFDRRPPDLFRQLADLRAQPEADVLKIAFRARSLRDNIDVFELLGERDRPTIALAMADTGLLSRVLAPKFGGLLTFASLDAGAATAEGQPTVRDLVELYRFRDVDPATFLYGVVGWPVAHSLSPNIHNAGFEALNHNGVYLPMPVAPEWEHLKATLATLLDFGPLHLAGLSVTIPHKQHLLRFAKEDHTRRWLIDPVAERAGVANTLAISGTDSEGAVYRVMNTDVPAVTGPLAEAIGAEPNAALGGRRIGVLGAGGAARAAALGCFEAGAAVTVFARSAERAHRLAEDIAQGSMLRLGTAAGAPPESRGRIDAKPLDAVSKTPCDVFINCTPIGMSGGDDEHASPLTDAALDAMPPDGVVFDTVYNPPSTPLLRAARQRGLTLVDGVEMFVHQAAAQFHAWTGQPAPVRLFRRVVLESLPPDEREHA